MRCIRSQLETDKWISTFTDGGARPSPGQAGWDALVRQNKKVIWHWSHRAKATYNAVELTAVIGTLGRLLAGRMINITTDSVYLKKRTTEWLGKWLSPG
jgi:ribonuclease HI